MHDRAFAPLPSSAVTSSLRPVDKDAGFILTPADSGPGNVWGSSPDMVWLYKNLRGQNVLAIARWNQAGGGKRIFQATPWTDSLGNLGWLMKGHPEPRPLYGLDRLAERPDADVLIVEGEKSADAAALLCPDHVVLTWPGGCRAAGKVDWAPLAGRRVILWPDSDKPGVEAMSMVGARLANLASAVAIVDLSRVAEMLGEALPAGWDLADAPADWTPATVAGLLPEPTDMAVSTCVADDIAAIVERHLQAPAADVDPAHAGIVVEIISRMHERGLAIDALMNFRDEKTWTRVACDPGAFAEDAAFALRASGARADAGRVGETFRTMARRDQAERRQDLVQQFLGKPASASGMSELRRWVRAVTGEERPADVAALSHWLWQVKTRVAGLHGELHLMLVVYGAVQGSGKSVAVGKLCAPWQELFDPDVGLGTLTDDRNAPHLASCAVGFWDELGGLARADMEILKHRLTAPTVAYRPMRTNSRIEAPMLMSFIAASNRSIGELVKDATGMRRFFEIRAADRIDWEAVNGIDYALLWQAASELDGSPGKESRAIIEAAQAHLVWRDPVQRWLAEEEDGGWGVVVPRLGEPLPSADPSAGCSLATLYLRFSAWCEEAGERELTRELVGRRLGDLGWIQFRMARSNGRGSGWRRGI